MLPRKYFFEGTGLEPLLAKDDSVLFFGTFVPVWDLRFWRFLRVGVLRFGGFSVFM